MLSYISIMKQLELVVEDVSATAKKRFFERCEAGQDVLTWLVDVTSDVMSHCHIHSVSSDKPVGRK